MNTIPGGLYLSMVDGVPAYVNADGKPLKVNAALKKAYKEATGMELPPLPSTMPVEEPAPVEDFEPELVEEPEPELEEDNVDGEK